MATETKAQRERRELSETVQRYGEEMQRPKFAYRMIMEGPMAFLGRSLDMAVRESIITPEQAGQIRGLVQDDLAND